MNTPATDSFLFGDHQVIVNSEAYYDLIFFAPYEWCQFLLDHNGWRYLDEACHVFHRDHVKMIADWATIEAEKLPEEMRHPIDGTVRDMPTLIRFLAAALHWKVANRKLDDAHNDYADGEPNFVSEQAVRAAAKDLIDAALDYPPPYRDNMVERPEISSPVEHSCTQRPFNSTVIGRPISLPQTSGNLVNRGRICSYFRSYFSPFGAGTLDFRSGGEGGN